MKLNFFSSNMQEYEWPDGSVEVGGADFDMWTTIGQGLNFNFRLGRLAKS